MIRPCAEGDGGAAKGRDKQLSEIECLVFLYPISPYSNAYIATPVILSPFTLRHGVPVPTISTQHIGSTSSPEHENNGSQLVPARASSSTPQQSIAGPLAQLGAAYTRTNAAQINTRDAQVQSWMASSKRLPPSKRGLLGFEHETLPLTNEFQPRGTVLAELPYGEIQSDARGFGSSSYESVSDALPDPKTVDRFNRSTAEFFVQMQRWAEKNPGKKSTISEFWQADHVTLDISISSNHSIRNGIIIGQQASTGVSLEKMSDLLTTAFQETGPPSKKDAIWVAHNFRTSHGHALSKRVLGLLHYIGYYVRCTQQDLSQISAHSFFAVMSRGSFSSYYQKLSRQDRDDMDKILLAQKGNSLPLFMRSLNYRFGQTMFRNPYVCQSASSRGAISSGKVPTAVGPTIGDWLHSIVDPQRFGRTTDLMSPPEGMEQDGAKQLGMGNLGDTGDPIVELRDFEILPARFPATGAPIVGMLVYQFCQRFNPNLPHVDFVEGGQQEEDAIKAFADIGELCSDIGLTVEHLYDGRKLELLSEIKRSVRQLRNLIETHGGVDDIASDFDQVLDAAAFGTATPPDTMRPLAERLLKKLTDGYPRIGEALFSENLRRWRAAIAAATPSPGEEKPSFV